MSSSPKIPDMYFMHKSFLVFDENYAKGLREKRIIGQLIGCSPQKPYQIATSGLPLQYSAMAALYAHFNGFATLKSIQRLDNFSVEENTRKFGARFEDIRARAFKTFETKQIEESMKRNIEVRAGCISSKFHEKRVKVSINSEIEPGYSTSIPVPLNESEIDEIVKENLVEYQVYKDLNDRGFYVSSGLNFGCNFLAYPSDPLMYHATYAIRVVPDNGRGLVDLTSIDYGEVNSLHRLCHTAKKILLLAVVHNDAVKYWTMETREYITPESEDSLKPIDPCPILGKGRKLSAPRSTQ